jgi:hypothetical protein
MVKRDGEGVIAVDGLIVRKSLRDSLTGAVDEQRKT